jgi:type II secretory pathway pseudopilin PulG
MNNTRAFSVVEVLIGIVVFIIGISSVFLLIQSVQVSARNTQAESVLAGLLQEQLESARALRDSAWIAHNTFDTLPDTTRWETGVYIFTPTASGGSFLPFSTGFIVSDDTIRQYLLSGSSAQFRRCIENGIYAPCTGSWLSTPFSQLLAVEHKGDWIKFRSLGASRITNRVLEMPTILSSWKTWN